ncbi:MAG: sugar ABC transporter substrate-binding protein [Rubrobacteraceae bacterium]|nr:sugar ABC transporter substrate-binding protein [Rubrobacteraceae bacterium]
MSVFIDKSPTAPGAQKQWMDKISAQFQKQTGVKVSWDSFSSSDEEQRKMENAVTTGNGPDIFVFGSTFIPSAQATGGFHVLTSNDWKLAGGKSRIFKQQLTMAGTSPDKLISVPFSMRPFAMVYNTELFRKAGISSPPKTWTEFVQDAKKITDPSQGVYGAEIDPADSYDPWKIWWTFVRQMGGRFVSKDLKTALLDSPEVQKAVQFWFDWATKYKIADPHSMTWQSTDALRAFVNGKVGMQIMISTSVEPTLRNSKVKGKYAFAPMPTVPYGMQQRPPGGEPASTIVSGDYLAVAKYSKAKDSAYKLIKLMTDYQPQIQYSKAVGDLPVNKKAATYLASKSKTAKAFIEAEQNATPTPMTGAWATLEVALANVSAKLGNAVAAGNYSPSLVKSLLEKANQQVQAQLR